MPKSDKEGCQFESSVILQGSKTIAPLLNEENEFESSVILQGSKTFLTCRTVLDVFESSVIYRVVKRSGQVLYRYSGLRVV